LGFFLYPAATSSVCERSFKRYNFFDILTGKGTDELFDCINKVMENDINTITSSSVSTFSSFSSSASPENENY
jgi:hypothetical protein